MLSSFLKILKFSSINLNKIKAFLKVYIIKNAVKIIINSKIVEICLRVEEKLVKATGLDLQIQK
jgi:hypothetical protein